jgi:hypothetical protein
VRRRGGGALALLDVSPLFLSSSDAAGGGFDMALMPTVSTNQSLYLASSRTLAPIALLSMGRRTEKEDEVVLAQRATCRFSVSPSYS